MTVVERAAAAVDAARVAFADADTLARASHQEVVDLLALTAELTRVVDAQRVRLAGALAERSTGAAEQSICRLLGSRNAREAVGKAFGIRTRDAAELLTLAAATTSAVSITGETIAIGFPRVADALDSGALSLPQARAIIGTLAPAAPRADLEQLAWAEGCLVDEATHPEHRLAPELLVTQAQAYVAVLDPDGVLPDSERQRALRSLRMRHMPDGSWSFVIRSTAEGGSAIKAVVDAYTAPRVDVRFTDDPEGFAEATSDADAQVPADDRSLAQKRHDALVAMAEAHAASGGAPVAGGEVPRLVLTGTIEAFSAYMRDVEHPDRTLTIEHTGSVVPIETVDRLLCNGVVQRAVTDARGQVLELGRTQRLFTKAQRQALAAQYGGCATPGCGYPVAWTEAHHVVWWQCGGTTDVANGILLCSHCHHEVHAGRLLVVGDPGHWRVVPQLRPADPYARATRSRGIEFGASGFGDTGSRDMWSGADGSAVPFVAPAASITAPAAAAAPLAFKLPEPVEASSPPVLDGWNGMEHPAAIAVRRPRGAGSAIEARLRRRRPGTSSCLSPPHRTGQDSLVISTLTKSWLLPAPAYTPRSGGTSL